MNRIHFIEDLTHHLAYHLSPSQIHDWITYYETRIDELIEHGHSEKTAVLKQGDPKQIANHILAPKSPGVDFELRPARRKWHPLFWLLLLFTSPLWGSALLGSLGIGIAIYLCIWAIPFTSACISITCLAGGAIATVLSPFLMVDALGNGVIQLGAGLLLIASGLLSLAITYFFSKYFLALHRFFFETIAERRMQKKAALI